MQRFSLFGCGKAIVILAMAVRYAVALTAAPALAAAGESAADHASQYARLDTLGQYASVAPWCEKLGYPTHVDRVGSAANESVNEAVAGGMEIATARAVLLDALKNHQQQMTTDLSGSLSRMATNPTIKLEVTKLADRLSQQCVDAAQDPIFGKVIENQPPEESQRNRTAFVDALTDSAGEASWQTASISARGELLFGVGVCRGRLSTTKAHALTGEVIGAPVSNDPAKARAQRYYAKMYVDGLQSAQKADLDETQCARMLAIKERKLKRALSESAH